VPWMTRSASARSSTPQCRDGWHGRSRKPTRRSVRDWSPFSRGQCGTTCLTVHGAGNCLPMADAFGLRCLLSARLTKEGSPAKPQRPTPAELTKVGRT